MIVDKKVGVPGFKKRNNLQSHRLWWFFCHFGILSSNGVMIAALLGGAYHQPFHEHWEVKFN